MSTGVLILLYILAYMVLLFVVARWTEVKGTLARRRVAEHPLVYSLSLGVYCTSWTYYGSVGFATRTGLQFLSIYLGPTLCIILWGILLRKLVRIKTEHHITSIADFIAARYDRSQVLGALATLVAVVGTMPYIALQLKAVNTTFTIVSGEEHHTFLSQHLGGVVLILMIVFTIVFGVRRIDPTERHQGMIAAIAFESVVKLLAFLAVGIFVTYGLFDGFGDIISRLEQNSMGDRISLFGHNPADYGKWTTILFLSMSAILFLPRQFHVAVIENSDEKHIPTAMWVLPVYMVLINLFVVPIAMGGLLNGLPLAQADTFVLRLPLESGHRFLALLVFIGGFSAATGMIMISAMTLSTMIVNHLFLPSTQAVGLLSFFQRRVLAARWLTVAFVLLIGYWFERTVGESYILVNMGLIAFSGAVQFAPPVLTGIFWQQANKTGALLGLGGGFAVWFYTLFLPALLKSGTGSRDLLTSGPFGIAALRPEALLNVELDHLTHTLIWSMIFNIGGLFIGSILFRQTDREARIAKSFVGQSDKVVLVETKEDEPPEEPDIPFADKAEKIKHILYDLFSDEDAQVMFERCTQSAGIADRETISISELSRLVSEIEKTLAGSFGSAMANRILARGDIYTPEETKALASVYRDLLTRMKLDPQELSKRIDFYKEREEMLSRHAGELEAQVAETRRSNVELEQFAYVASHDLQEPLRTVQSFLQLLQRRYAEKLDEEANEFIDYAVAGASRMRQLITDLLTYSRVTTRARPPKETNLNEVIAQVVAGLDSSISEAEAEIHIGSFPTLACDRRQIMQLFQNLLSNALKFRGEVKPRIELAAQQREEEWLFSVRDNGIGIAPQYFEKIFMAFKRLHTHDECSGSGIGLAICKKIVENQGGRIWVESSVGEGATFFFTLPITNEAGDATS